jgi:hypothetical protein
MYDHAYSRFARWRSTSQIQGIRRPKRAIPVLVALLLAVAAAVLWPGPGADAADKVVTTSTGVRTHGAIKSTKYTVGWLLECKYSHTAKDDPIVHPNMPGMAHNHDFFGNATTNANSTITSMLASTSTTCDTAADTAGYWAPALLVSGKTVSPKTTSQQIYYRSRYASGVVIEPIPTDLRIVVGNMNAKSVAENPALSSGAIVWECHGSDKKYSTPPSCGDQYLVENVQFPSCWDGVLTHKDDSAHMTYVAEDGRCPAKFSHPLPRISLKIKYPVASSSAITLASGSTFTAHADFWNAWQPAGIRYLVDKCLNAGISCGTSPIAPMGN